MLIFTEAYGEKIKMFKYYYCTTLFVYESIWLLSIMNLVRTLMNTWPVDEYIKEFQDMPLFESDFFVSIAKLLYLTTCGIAYFSHWVKNTYVHILLCRCKISGVSKCLVEKILHSLSLMWIKVMKS